MPVMRTRSPRQPFPPRHRILAVCALPFAGLLAQALPAQQVLFQTAAPQFVPMPPRTGTIASAPGDFDRDGDIDILRIEHDCAWFLRNDGEGRFVADPAARTPLPLLPGLFARNTAVGDIDGDGDLDFVGASTFYGPSVPMVLVNDGQGRFTDQTAARWAALADAITGIALADLDNDGDLDLITACTGTEFDPPNDGTNRIYRNDGTGRFANAPILPNPIGRFGAVVAADFDRDGDIDLLFGPAPRGTSSLRYYRNLGTILSPQGVAITTLPYVSLLLPIDDDGDGDLDLLVSNGSQTELLRNRAGTLTPVGAVPAGFHPTDGAATDLDRDGDLDLVLIGNLDGFARAPTPHAWRNLGNGVFADATPAHTGHLPTGGATWLADLDADGDADLFDGEVYFQDAAGRFVRCVDPDLPPLRAEVETGPVAAGDLDGDGSPDVVRAFRDNRAGREQLEVFRNDGRGGMTPVTGLPATAGLRIGSVLLADIDGDRDLDLLLAVAGQDRILRNDGGMTFTDVTATLLPVDHGTTNHIAAGDLDGDGDVDLLLARGTGYGEQDRLLRQQNGVFVDDTVMGLPPETRVTSAILLRDLDGDGDLDAVCADYLGPGSLVRLLRNDGSGVFLDVTAGNSPLLTSTWGIFALDAGDLDGDGDLDLLVADPQPHIWQNDGAGTFTDVSALVLPPPQPLRWPDRLVDVDGDGDLDITDQGEPPQFFRNDGQGMFQVVPWGIVGPRGGRRAFVDVDRDGDLDDVSERGILRNLTRQVLVTVPPRVGLHGEIDLVGLPGWATAPQTVLVALAPGLAAVPMPLPGVGVLQLDPAVLRVHSLQTIPVPGGRVTLRYRVPGQPALVGAMLAVQALFQQGGARRFANAVLLDVRL